MKKHIIVYSVMIFMVLLTLCTDHAAADMLHNYLSQEIAIENTGLMDVFLKTNPPVQTGKKGDTFSLIPQEDFKFYRAKHFLKENKIEEAVDAYLLLGKTTAKKQKLFQEIVDEGLKELAFALEEADFDYVRDMSSKLSEIAFDDPRLYLYLGAVEILEDNHEKAFDYFSFAQALTDGDPSYKLLSNMSEFIVLADNILHEQSKGKEDYILADIVESIYEGRQIIELAESFGFIGYKNEFAIKAFVRNMYSVYIVFPAMVEMVEVYANAVSTIGIDVELGYDLNKFIYEEDQEVAFMYSAKNQNITGRVFSFPANPVIVDRSKQQQKLIDRSLINRSI